MFAPDVRQESERWNLETREEALGIRHARGGE
jgi:hypothetical protein